MNGWVGDGSGLHKQEHGCGALTDWDWHSVNGISWVTFNLPFFIKDGCVERAIVSAGGPKISCKGHSGLKKRSVAEKPIPELNLSVDETVAANAKSSIDEAFAHHSDSQVLSDYAKPSLLRKRSYELVKRGCWPSKESPSSSNAVPFEWICNAVIPGVDECVQKIADKGNVGQKTSLFYSAGASQAACRKWAIENLDCGGNTWVLWSGIVDMDWYFATTKAIERPFGPEGQNLPFDQVQEKSDPYPKNLSQAFGEASAGRAYICIPEGVASNSDWDVSSAWGGWEYPALTRAQAVTEIYRVDPSQNNPRSIWARASGDGPSAQEPKGTRGTSLPMGLPDSQMPPNWQSSP
ncbi:MAG: hypothetical protein M1822_001758 [Bathelium mastoideum]|nr:MAG: hypothetical protein M1822_001758 [Bathelium mastoideum]